MLLLLRYCCAIIVQILLDHVVNMFLIHYVLTLKGRITSARSLSRRTCGLFTRARQTWCWHTPERYGGILVHMFMHPLLMHHWIIYGCTLSDDFIHSVSNESLRLGRLKSFDCSCAPSPSAAHPILSPHHSIHPPGPLLSSLSSHALNIYQHILSTEHFAWFLISLVSFIAWIYPRK